MTEPASRWGTLVGAGERAAGALPAYLLGLAALAALAYGIQAASGSPPPLGQVAAWIVAYVLLTVPLLVGIAALLETVDRGGQ